MKNLIKNSLILFLALTLFNCSKDVIPPDNTADNTAPVAVDDIASTTVNNPINVPVLSNDSDPNGDSITVTNINGTAVALGDGVQVPVTGGTATLLANGTIEVTPTADSTTPISFPYTIDDGNGGTDTAQVELSVIETAFVTTWKTDNSGFSNDNQIKISTNNNPSSYTVDWGDGEISTNLIGDNTHTYATAGTYTVKITENFVQIYFDIDATTTDAEKLLSVENWGNTQWETMNNAFAKCTNLIINATDVPNLSNVTDMSRMFFRATSFNTDISGWNVSNVTDMSRMFLNASSFNQPIGTWEVNAVTDMSGMFGATSFNQPIGSWDVSAVTDMSGMFNNTSSFNQPIGDWEVSAVTNMVTMFWDASAFNQPIGSWKVSAVTDMSFMFWEAASFNQLIGDWEVSAVTDMSGMFWEATSFNQPIGDWKVNAVTNMAIMFQDATSFSNKDLSSWPVANVTHYPGFMTGAGAGNTEPNWP